MTELSPRHLRIAAYVVGEDLARRSRFGHPVPAALRDLEAALRRAILSESGHETCTSDDAESCLETAEQLAERIGVTARTIRRNATRYGGTKVGDQWVFSKTV